MKHSNYCHSKQYSDTAFINLTLFAGQRRSTIQCVLHTVCYIKVKNCIFLSVLSADSAYNVCNSAHRKSLATILSEVVSHSQPGLS